MALGDWPAEVVSFWESVLVWEQTYMMCGVAPLSPRFVKGLYGPFPVDRSLRNKKVPLKWAFTGYLLTYTGDTRLAIFFDV